MQATDINGRLEIPNARSSDSGEYICSVIGVVGRHQAIVRLDVEDICEYFFF